jgi:hypothetical protein
MARQKEIAVLFEYYKKIVAETMKNAVIIFFYYICGTTVRGKL